MHRDNARRGGRSRRRDRSHPRGGGRGGRDDREDPADPWSPHAGGTADLRERLGVPVGGPEREDACWIDRIEADGARYGMTWCRRFAPDRGLATKLWPLGDDVTFVPGHGPLSTFGNERAANPYVGDAVLRG
jgi:glyoxylase-like metal-dependent hydrolase (beta-lactamase superfamily II)